MTPARVSGENRYDTAANIAELQHPEGADWALVARGDTFPDALAASPVAAELDAPILLTQPDDVPDRTMQALEALGATQVKVLGGTSAVAPSAVDELESQGIEVDRLAGENRYATAAELARYVQGRNDNRANYPGGQRAVFLATGEDYPDALAAGAPAAQAEGPPIPVLLSAHDTPTQPTIDLVEQQNVELVIVVGGEAAISTAVTARLEDEDTNVVRVAGESRFQTAVELAEFSMDYLDITPSTVELTRADTFPDALAAAPLAGELSHPILLAGGPSSPPVADQAFYDDHCGDVSTIRAIGGQGAITTAQLNEHEAAAENCHEASTRQSYIVGPQEPISADAGEKFQFHVGARYDGSEVQEQLDIVLFPHAAISESDGTYTFADTNDDGRADGIESTTTDAAVITAVNGEDIVDTKGIRDVGKAGGDPDAIEATLTSDSDDQVTVVFFHDANNNSALDLDADDRPVEAWGFGRISWTS